MTKTNDPTGMTNRIRLALAPSGFLTIAQARLAFAAQRSARASDGKLILRLDNLSDREDQSEALRHDLRWLGLTWDEEYRQSERLALHADAIARLKSAGKLYPCFEHADELRSKRDRRIRERKPPIYDRAAIRMTAEQREAAEAGGKRPHWRYLLSDRVITWLDTALGRQHVELAKLSDPVVITEDGSVLPTLASALDDISLGITHIFRGADDLSVSAIQLDIISACGANPNRLTLTHLPALLGEGQAKRARDEEKLTIRQLRHDGIEASAIAEHLTVLAKPSNTAPRLNSAHLLAANRRALAALSFANIAPRLPAGATEAFWAVLRGQIDLPSEARLWWDVVAGDITPPIIDDPAGILPEALRALPPEPWNTETYAAWLKALRLKTDHPHVLSIRLALTGEEHGPALDALLPLITRARVERRLRATMSAG